MLNLNAMFNVSSVTLDTSEDIEVSNESLDTDYLLNDLSSSLNVISSQFSTLMSGSNRIRDMYSYIKLYGVDRACVQVYNRDGLLTDLSNGVVPAIEDFRESNVSKYTIACMEGLGESIAKAFKWCIEKLKAIGKWIADKVIGAFKWLMSKFSSNKKQIANGMKQNEKLALMANKIKGDESQITPEMKQKVAEVDEAYIKANKKLSDDISFQAMLVDSSNTIIKSCFDMIESNIRIAANAISKINAKEESDPVIPDEPKVDFREAGKLAAFSKENGKKELEMLEKITEAYTAIYSGKTEATPEYGGVLKHCIKSQQKFAKEIYIALAKHESMIEQIIQESTGHAAKLEKEVEQLHSDLAKALEKVDVNSVNKLHQCIGHCIARISEDLQAITTQILDLGKYRLMWTIYPNMSTLDKMLDDEAQKYLGELSKHIK
jgi:hypothetical protein